MTGEAPPSTDHPCPSPLQARQEIPSGEMIWLTLNLLFSLGQVVELRSWDKRGKIRSGYYNDMEALTKAAEALDLPETEGVYITLNEIKPELLYRRSNRIDFVKTGESTSDQDVIRRLWLPIDTDPERPVAKISSTNEEHEKAIEKAYSLKGILVSLGFPAPIIADSGNGGHVLVKIDLPNTTENSLLIANCLQALQDIAGDEKIKIDQTSKNPARVWKLYGTVARKGDNLPERPHRRARLLEVPEKIEAVSRELLEQLAALKTETPPPPAAKKAFTKSIDLAEWLSANSSRLPPYTSVSKPGWRYFYKFESCPFNSAHTTGAFVGQLHNGALVAKCHHNSCGALTQRWDDLRAMGEPDREKTKATEIPPQETGKTTPEVFIAAFKNENGSISPGRVAAYLGQKFIFITLDDTEEVRVYRDGIYEYNGEAVIKKEIQGLLGATACLNTANEVIGHIRRSSLISRKALDPDPFLLALNNGVLDLRTMQLSEHRPELLMTVRIPLIYDPAATNPESEKFWSQIVDSADLPIIKEWFGYCLYRGYPIQKALMLVGDGDNGKSTLISQMRAFLGIDNVSSIELQKLGDRFSAAALYGKLANLFADISSKELKSSSYFKMLTSGMDSIPAEYKFKNQFTFINYAKLIYSCNVLPNIEEDTHAVFKRWSILNFPNQFTGNDQDKTILSKITTPQELSGVLNAALAALAALMKRGEFTGNIKADVMRDQYKRMADPVYAFCQDELVVDSNEYLIKRELYAVFTNWGHKKQIPVMSKEAFHQRLPRVIAVREERPIVNGKQERVWYGVKFKSPQELAGSNNQNQEQIT